MEHMGITNVHRFQMVSTDSSLRMRPATIAPGPPGLVLSETQRLRPARLAQQWFFQEKACEKIGG
jgi:hypothetical protein